jgi:NAD(P)-dependent dehydrogenase (short-subunit alcohol dehydrogenase family)
MSSKGCLIIVEEDQLMDRLQEMILIVTRAVRGFGKRIANKLFQERVKGAVVDSSNDTCVNTDKVISGKEHTAPSYVANITKQDVVQDDFKFIEEIGSVEMLVNNARINRNTPLKELTGEQLEQVIFEYNFEFYMFTRGC